MGCSHWLLLSHALLQGLASLFSSFFHRSKFAVLARQFYSSYNDIGREERINLAKWDCEGGGGPSSPSSADELDIGSWGV